jgi:hypothetical protein
VGEEHWLRGFENRVLRGILVPRRDEVTGGRSKLQNEEFHDLCSLSSILQEVGWEGMGWIDLDQERDRLLAVVNAIMNLRVPYSAGNYLTS